jgi:alpha-glucosidase (family GH31 glycosyl hydrolase)
MAIVDFTNPYAVKWYTDKLKTLLDAGVDCFSASYASMAETLRGGLSITMSGFSFWSHDISGFEQTATPDLYKRWVQFGLLSTHSRLHGSTSYRVPWLFDEEACDVVRYFTNLKCELMPYIYYMAINAHKIGVPVMRSMFLEFPGEAGMNYLCNICWEILFWLHRYLMRLERHPTIFPMVHGSAF